MTAVSSADAFRGLDGKFALVSSSDTFSAVTEVGLIGAVPKSDTDFITAIDNGFRLRDSDSFTGTESQVVGVPKSSADTFSGAEQANPLGRFANVLVDGVGTVNFMTKNSSGVIVGGADTHGYYRSSDDGDHWQSINHGVGGVGVSDSWRQSASIAWSVTETNTLYSCTGEAGAGGGLLVSNDGGNTWFMRTTVPQFAGNHQFSPLPSGGTPRSTGRLIAQDNGYLFLGTYAQGVMRSANNGTDNFPVTCTMAGSAPGSNYYVRSLITDPNNPGTLYVAMYDYDGTGTFGHIWKCTSDTAGTPNFTKLTASPAIVEEMVIVGTYLYAVAGGAGVSRSTDGGTTWSNLDGAGVPTSGGQDWFSVDGYVDGSGNHVIFICDSNPASASQCIISLTIPSTFPGSGSITYANLTGSVQLSTMPPDGRSFWNTGGATLGRASWQNGSVVVDASNLSNVKLYACGPGGFFRNLGGAGWTICSNGQAGFPARSVACDPLNAGHMQLTGTDWGTFDISDGIGLNASTAVNLVSGGGGQQGYGVSFDPADSTVYAAFGDKGVAPTWGTNTSGGLFYRATGTTSWTNTGLATALSSSGKVPLGVLGLRDGSATKLVLAAVWNQGLWVGTWGGSSYSWAQASSAFCVTSAAPAGGNQFMFGHAAGSQYVYLFDPASGVWRSNNYGKNAWVQVNTLTSADKNSFSITASETTPGEIWVTANGGLYKITGAHTGTVGAGATQTGPLSLPGSASSGCLAASPSGTIYVSTEDTPGSGGTGILASPDHGVSWFDAVGDGSLAQSNSRPVQMVIAADGRLYLAGSNVVTQGYPLASGSAPVSDIDAFSGADAGETIHLPVSADTFHGTDAGETIRIPVSADTFHGTDAGESFHITLSSADTFHGTDAGESIGVSIASADTFHGTDAGESFHITLSDSDTAHGAEASNSPSGNVPVASADTGRFQDSEIDYFASAETATGTDVGVIHVSSADSGTTVSSHAVNITGTIGLSDADRVSAGENQAVAGQGSRSLTDTDLAHGTDTGPVFPLAITSADTGSAAENLATHAGTGVAQSGIDVWTTIPDNMFLHGGDGLYNVVWHAGREDEIVVIQGAPLTRGLLEMARELAGMDSLVLAGDSDSVTATESNTALATVSGVILATRVAAEIPGRTGAPGQFGYAQGFPELASR